MPKFGRSSNARLRTCHTVLQTLAHRVVARRDCSVTEGHRDGAKQDQYYYQGVSKVKWPNSKHNIQPSFAIDLVPWPEKWDSETAFLDLHKTAMEEWDKMTGEGLTGGFLLRWGGDWDSDGDRTDQTFNDLPHYELVRP